MALSPQKPLVAKSITQSMREVIDDLQFAIKSSHRTIEDCREAIAAANEFSRNTCRTSQGRLGDSGFKVANPQTDGRTPHQNARC
jgi:hypothetical protein